MTDIQEQIDILTRSLEILSDADLCGAPGQKPRHGFERNYLRRPTLPSHCLSAMCPMPTNSSDQPHMGTAFTPAKTSPASWDAFSDVDAFVDAVLAELTAMAATKPT